jgi:hypothetical protein
MDFESFLILSTMASLYFAFEQYRYEKSEADGIRWSNVAKQFGITFGFCFLIYIAIGIFVGGGSSDEDGLGDDCAVSQRYC